MILVAGFNTAIDRHVDIDALHPGEVQRANRACVSPGGKGLHVAQMVAALGESACLVGLEDAAHATLLHDHCRARGVAWHPTRSPYPLRQCLALHEADGRTTEVLEAGAPLAEPLRRSMLATLRAGFASARVLVLSGSLPSGFPADTYADLVDEATRRNMPCLVDTSGEALRLAVNACPWLVKPNKDEASALVGHAVNDATSASECVRQLHTRGVACPVVTLGGKGAIGLDGKAVWHAWTDPVAVRNVVGSGDCFLAAMAIGVARGEPLDASLKWAIACGAANAESDETGFAEPARVRDWLPRTHVEKLT